MEVIKLFDTQSVLNVIPAKFSYSTNVEYHRSLCIVSLPIFGTQKSSCWEPHPQIPQFLIL